MKIIKILILLIVSSIFIISLAFFINNQKQISKQNEEQKIEEKQSDFLSNTNCPYITDLDLNLTYNNEVSVAFPPEPLDQREIVLPPQKFDPNASTIDGGVIFTRYDKKQIDIENIDIDGDGSMEQIVSIEIAMNHTPHVALIVKDGNIIFKEKGAQTYIFEASLGEFRVHKTIDWNVGEETITKYKYENNSIVPVWKQKLCNVRARRIQ